MRKQIKSRFMIKAAAFLVAIALVLAVGLNGFSWWGLDPVFGEGKKLPIYSVDLSDKKIAISFDCAWGNLMPVQI